MNEKIKILIVMEGGCLIDVLSMEPGVVFDVHDYDEEDEKKQPRCEDYPYIVKESRQRETPNWLRDKVKNK